MNPRERVKTSLNHKEGDRIPIDHNNYVSGMSEIAYRNLLKYLKTEDEIKIYDYVQRLALVKEEILGMFGVDTRYILPKAPSNFIFDGDPENEFKDEFGVVYRRCGYYADIWKPPLRGKTLEEIKKYKFPDLSDNSRFDGSGIEAKNLSENTNYSIWAGAIPALFYTAWTLRGMQDFTIDLYTDPKMAFYLVDRIMDYWMEYMEKFLNQVGSYVDVFWGGGDDWGHQGGPMISPDLFKTEVVPRLKKMIGFFKSKTNAKCCYHSCGSVYWCLEDLIEVGVDIIHPLQPNAYGNDTDKVKKEFGRKICFHGGTNNQGVFDKNIHILTIDTLKRIKDLAPDGGYIFSSGHNIQANTPPENIVRLFELAKEYGKYPIDIGKIDSRIEQEKKF